MRRREFIVLGACAMAAWPLAARSQQRSIPVIGFLNGGTADAYAKPVAGFRRGLVEAGLVEGRNVFVEFRWADGQYGRLAALASDLINRQVTVIVAAPLSAALEVKALTTTIPVVFTSGSDPVDFGLVDSLNRPGGNLTGMTQFTHALVPKRLELIRELIPEAKIVAMLVNPDGRATPSTTAEALAAARTLGLRMSFLNAKTDVDLPRAFAALAEQRAAALVVTPDPFFSSRVDRIAALAQSHAVPAIYGSPEFPAAGGLMSYGPDTPDLYRHMALYVGRILKGDKPADLPVMQPTKFELVINLKSAKGLGLTVPPQLLARAHEVIE
jgi:putative ABC transport system substrate-binding protein